MEKQYKVLSASTPEALEAMVNEQLISGAELVGGASVSSHFEICDRKGYTECQADYTYIQAVLAMA